MSPGNFLETAERLPLSSAQREALSSVRQLLEKCNLNYLDSELSQAGMGEEGSLVIEICHAKAPEVVIKVSVDDQGRLDILCAALHPTFELAFNDIWEPEEDFGSLADGVAMLGALLTGQLVSEVKWSSGERVARSTDYLIDSNGKREEVLTQVHAAAAIEAVASSRLECRRVDFNDENGIVSRALP